MTAIEPWRLQRLRAAADAGRALHFSRYTDILVLAAAETTCGAFAGGSNIETADLSLTKHAEQLAIIAAFREAKRPPELGGVARLYVAGPPPCGSCRQFAVEFGAPDSQWIYEPVTQEELRGRPLVELPADRQLTVMSFAEALPCSFTRAAVAL